MKEEDQGFGVVKEIRGESYLGFVLVGGVTGARYERGERGVSIYRR